MDTDGRAPFAHRSIWLGVHDALSARIARDAPIAGIWLSSYGVSASLGANPDASLLTSTDMLGVARAACRAAGEMPVIVDCDTGYGDATVFASAVDEFAATTKVAAVCLEDKVFPKRNTLASNTLDDLESTQLFVSKLQAGLRARARGRPTLRIIARTEALAVGAGVEEAVRRLEAYAAAGADALLVQSKGPIDELADVARRARATADVPIVCVPTSYSSVPASTWWGYGYDVVVRSHQLLQAAVAAQLELLDRIAAGEVPPITYAGAIAPHDVINALVARDLDRG